MNKDKIIQSIMGLNYASSIPQKDKKRVYYRIDPKIIESFKDACTQNNMKQVRIIESLMKLYVEINNDDSGGDSDAKARE